jgi:hypothetical protein
LTGFAGADPAKLLDLPELDRNPSDEESNDQHGHGNPRRSHEGNEAEARARV